MITIPRGTRVDQGSVQYAAEMFARERAPAMRRLDDYLDGRSAVSYRTKPFGAPNNRLAHPFARYIVTMAAGYLAGAPIAYSGADQEEGLAALCETYRAANADAIDGELAEQASLYGVGVELLYLDERARVRLAALNPGSAFVVYDDSAEHRPVMGVHMREPREYGGGDRFEATVWTASESFEMAGASPRSLRVLGAPRPHYFQGVPLVEYWNNSREKGDVEPVISLIDAYDALQSDRVNDKQQFAESLLVFTGVSGFAPSDEPGDTRPIGRRLREDQAIALPDRDARVEWLTKRLNETDAQVLADSIRQDLHTLSMTPNTTDERFAGNASGVAMRYKLMGLEQLTRVKERWFREGLRCRMRLAAGVIAMKGGPALDPERVQIVFNRSLPSNLREEAEALSSLRGLVPDELLLDQVGFIEDAKAALRMRRATTKEE
ncbi:MAG: phage portal protein [Oscillospiraceae bacterium]|jgi:SPP1 family phage portal protein|nr:phage portal protein [Oscillospiraceae bacterium]